MKEWGRFSRNTRSRNEDRTSEEAGQITGSSRQARVANRQPVTDRRRNRNLSRSRERRSPSRERSPVTFVRRHRTPSPNDGRSGPFRTRRLRTPSPDPRRPERQVSSTDGERTPALLAPQSALGVASALETAVVDTAPTQESSRHLFGLEDRVKTIMELMGVIIQKPK